MKTDHRISQSCCFLFAQDQITKLRAEVSQLKEREESLKSQVGPLLTSLCYCYEPVVPLLITKLLSGMNPVFHVKDKVKYDRPGGGGSK